MYLKFVKLPLVCLLVLFAMAGCSKEPDLPVISLEPVEVRFAFLPDAADYEPLAAQFNSQSATIQVTLVPFSFTSDFQTELLEQISRADVVRLNPVYLPPEAGDLFQSLEPYLYVDQEFPTADFFPGGLEALKNNNEQMGIPAGLSPMIAFYANEHFEDLHVDPPQAGWTLEDFINIAKAVNKQEQADFNAGDYRYAFCTDPDGTDAFIFTYLFGGGIFSIQAGSYTPNLDDPANIEAVDWYASLFNEFKLTPKFSSAYLSGQFVANDHCAMWFDWFGLTDTSERQKQPGTVPLPSYRSDFDLVLLDAYFIPSSAEHPDQAWEWIRYLIQEQSASGIQIPPRKSLWESADYQARASSDIVATARNLSPNTVVLGVGSGGSDYLQAVIHEFNLAVDDVIRGSLSAQDALSQAQNDAESLFQNVQKTKESSSP